VHNLTAAVLSKYKMTQIITP